MKDFSNFEKELIGSWKTTVSPSSVYAYVITFKSDNTYIWKCIPENLIGDILNAVTGDLIEGNWILINKVIRLKPLKQNSMLAEIPLVGKPAWRIIETVTSVVGNALSSIIYDAGNYHIESYENGILTIHNPSILGGDRYSLKKINM